MDSKEIQEIKAVIQSCHLNFFIGAGMSAPFLKALGSTEELLTELEKRTIDPEEKKVVAASIYNKFFDDVIKGNVDILSNEASAHETLENYCRFFKTINTIILKRKNTMRTKQVNMFTTNVDIFIDKALDLMQIEQNDGFCGRFDPVFNLNNLKKSFLKTSLHYDNISEIPVFNLLKIHGSLTWFVESGSNIIKFSKELSLVKEIQQAQVSKGDLIEIKDGCTKAGCVNKDCNDPKHRVNIDDLIIAASGKKSNHGIEKFMNAYEKLSIINPTKEKFKTTLLNKTYYDQLRVYANELEKENTVLFVMGFSFADEHIRELTVKAADSNPTLLIYIFLRTSKSTIGIDISKLKNGNIKIIAPPLSKNSDGEMGDKYEHNLSIITKEVFEKVLRPEEEKIHKVVVVPTSEV